eukprot:gene6517-7810_t
MYDDVNHCELNTVPADDGSTYKEHALGLMDWKIIQQSVGPNLGTRGNIFFNHGCNKNPTVSLELKHEELAPSVRKGREALHTDYCKRYFEDLPLTELEDLCVATMLDPRFKNFDFEGMARFDSGKLTRERSVAWLRAAWIADWKVKEVETVGKKVEEKEQHVV